MKKNTIVLAIFVVFVCVFFISCKREHHAFPYELRAYFPYVENQELTFVNDNNQTMVARISRVEATETHYLPYTCKCGDGYDSQMFFNINNITDSFYFEGTMATHRDAFLMRCRCKLETDTWFDITEDRKGDPFSGHFSEILGDTVTLTKGNNEIVVIKGKGIAEFKIGDVVWQLKK